MAFSAALPSLAEVAMVDVEVVVRAQTPSLAHRFDTVYCLIKLSGMVLQTVKVVLPSPSLSFVFGRLTKPSQQLKVTKIRVCQHFLAKMPTLTQPPAMVSCLIKLSGMTLHKFTIVLLSPSLRYVFCLQTKP